MTATRHEESLSKVPISVTALTQDAMDERGIKDFQDIARFTPGVNIDTSGTNAISIRGISSSAGAGTTGIYIDDTPIQMRSLGFNPDDTLPKTFDLERVEVLRGPQGTLFGAGAEGGAVRYILTKASTTESSTYVRSEVSYTQYGQPSGEFGIAHGEPIIDGVFGLRASVWYRYDGGWINRADDTTGAIIDHNVNFSNSVAGRITGTWTPTSTLTVTPSVMYQQQDKNDDSTYWPAYSDASAGHFNTATPEKVGGPDTYYLPSLKVQWDLGGSQLISNSSYFSRRQLTAYQGTVYDLSYWQTIPNARTGISAGSDEPADRRQRHPPARGIGGHADPEQDDQHPREHHPGAALAVRKCELSFYLDRGRLLAGGKGGQHRGAEPPPTSIRCSITCTASRRRATTAELSTRARLGPIIRRFLPATFTTTTTRHSTARSRDSVS